MMSYNTQGLLDGIDVCSYRNLTQQSCLEKHSWGARNCGCNKKCVVIEYQVEKSFANWPSDNALEAAARVLGKDGERLDGEEVEDWRKRIEKSIAKIEVVMCMHPL